MRSSPFRFIVRAGLNRHCIKQHDDEVETVSRDSATIQIFGNNRKLLANFIFHYDKGIKFSRPHEYAERGEKNISPSMIKKWYKVPVWKTAFIIFSMCFLFSYKSKKPFILPPEKNAQKSFLHKDGNRDRPKSKSKSCGYYFLQSFMYGWGKLLHK